MNKHTPPTVQDFKNKGYNVKITHWRPVLTDACLWRLVRYLPPKQLKRILNENFVDLTTIRQDRLQPYIFPRGGCTTLFLIKDGEAGGKQFEAICSAQDIFSRKVGIMKCLYQASSLLNT